LGGHTIVDLHAGRQTIKIRIEGQMSYDEGERLFLRPDIQRLHLFSDKT
jgi:ABC-type sugar transport system ATPase subunit